MLKMDEWQRWKSRTEYAFDGLGYQWVLKDAKYPSQNTQINWVVYSKLAVATIGGTAHHLIKKDEDDKNGYGAWNDLCECYDRYDVKNKT